MITFKTLLFTSLAFTAVSAQAAQNVDVADCEIFVDDLALVTYGAYGASTESLVAHLVPRSDLNAQVLAAGGYFAANGQYKKIETEPDGSSKTTEWSAFDHFSIPATRTIDGKYLEVVFPLEWSTYDRDNGIRQVQDFAFYVTIKSSSGVIKTFWLKNGASNFSGESFSKERYFYSEPVFLGGYSSARYLWRDSGSPVFGNRSSCLGR